MLEVNPFGDPEVKKTILEESGYTPKENDTYNEEKEDLSEFQNIISSAPVIPKSGAVQRVIKDASAVLKDTQEAKANQLNLALSDVMTKYNQEFGLDLHIDFSSLSRTLINCADSKSQEVLQLYVSKLFRGLRPLIILNCISKLSLALDNILDPNKLLNEQELSLTDRFIAVDQIMSYIQKLEEMKDEILIPNEDLNLKRIAQENNIEYSEEDEKIVSDFLKLFKKDNGLN